MNAVPLNFYDAVFRIFYIDTIRTARELSGSFGKIAADFFENTHFRYLHVEDNAVSRETLYSFSRKEVIENEEFQKKGLRTVYVNLLYGNDKKVEKSVADRVRSIQGSSPCALALYTPTVTKAWIEWACSRRMVSELLVASRLDDASLHLCQQFVEKGALQRLQIMYEQCGDQSLGLMKAAVVQSQFQMLLIWHCAGSALRELLQHHAENRQEHSFSRQHVYKRVNLFGRCGEAAEVLEGKLERCSENEAESIGKNYFFFYRACFDKPSGAYKFTDGDVRAYVFFDCELKPDDIAELDFLKQTSRICVLLM